MTTGDALERELGEWLTVYPSIKEVLDVDPREYSEGEQAYFQKVISELATLRNEIPEKEEYDWAFSPQEIVEIMDNHAGGGWVSDLSEELRTRREKQTVAQICATRENFESERLYVNNIVRPWVAYTTPSADHGKYSITDKGIKRLRKEVSDDGQEKYISFDVCRTPFIICGISEPSDRECIYYKIRHGTYSGGVQEFWASQSELLSKRELKSTLQKNGINCPESGLLVETLEYVSRSIAEFSSRLKKEYSATQNGWNEERDRFVVGSRCITPNGVERVLTVSGDDKVFQSLTKKGSLSKWKDAVSDLLEYDLVRFKCYDAMSAPLKALLGAESHITDHNGSTSVGKTFSGWIALSMIGDAEAMTTRAKSTDKGILVKVKGYSDLPMLIDETSDAGDNVKEIVYTLTSNKGREKSTVDGKLDGGEQYRTAVMLTGEKPVRDVLTNAGQMYRVNELTDTLPTFEPEYPEQKTKVFRENHGHMIELYIQQIFRDKDRLEEMYMANIKKLPPTQTNIAGRSKLIFAQIMTAGQLLETVFARIGIERKDPEKIVGEYFKKCILDNPVELEYVRALQVVLDWVSIEYGRFEDDDTNEKRYGWCSQNYIDIIGTAFAEKMKKEGFSPTKIKSDWHNNGIVECNDKRPGVCRFKHNGKPGVGVRIIRHVAEEIIGLHVKPITFEADPNDQREKIKTIMKTVRMLTEIRGEAETRLIHEITEIDLDSLNKYLDVLAAGGKLLRVSQTAYKNV